MMRTGLTGGQSEIFGLRKALCVFLAAALSAAGGLSKVSAQDARSTIVGSVVNTSLNPVPSVRIVVKDLSGKELNHALTNAEGRYSIEKLPIGQYQLMLDPLQYPFQGETVVAYLGPEGLTVDWIVSESAKALAAATRGIASGGSIDWKEVGAVFLLWGSGGPGIAAAAGVFKKRTGRVTSSSQ